MSILIKHKFCAWLQRHPAARSWLWFASLWVGGILTVFLLTLPVKVLVHFL